MKPDPRRNTRKTRVLWGFAVSNHTRRTARRPWCVHIHGNCNLTIKRIHEQQRRDRLGITNLVERLVEENRRPLSCRELAIGRVHLSPALYEAYLRCHPADQFDQSLQPPPAHNRWPVMRLPAGLFPLGLALAGDTPRPRPVAHLAPPPSRRGRLIDVFA
ncbi:MAG: hypothetical protein K8S99_01835 [Planctomycetes bacterium]|nr:hypothetical protein [Planctomycetota bacterium]